MRIAVCEDENVYSDKLCKALEQYFSKRKVKTDITVYTDGKPLVEAYSGVERFDIVFLDIQLERSDGMNVASEIRNTDSGAVIIFVTSIENRAVEGYAVSAFDYIVKSSLDDRLFEVLDRFLQDNGNKFITFQTLDGDTAVIPCGEILYIESEGRGTAVNTSEGTVKTALSVSKTAELLPEGRFTEIHKSIFVQTVKIKRIGSDTVEMCSGKILPLSRRKRKQVLSDVMTAVRSGGK